MCRYSITSSARTNKDVGTVKPVGISRGYVAKMILSSGNAMSAAQRKASVRIVSLLGVKVH
jgi:hypothetical protein